MANQQQIISSLVSTISPYLKNALALVTGAAVWEGVKFVFPQIMKRIDDGKKARSLFDENISPILKAADELYGKMVSLAKEDFKVFKDRTKNDPLTVINRYYVCYLFSQFWANIELLRVKSNYFTITQTQLGEQLLKFIETQESRSFRILDRSLQRMIGETLIEKAPAKFRVLSLNEFCVLIKSNDVHFNSLFTELENRLFNTIDKQVRQDFFVYGAIVAILINHFDKKHKIVRYRKLYMNKLSAKSGWLIKSSLLEHYLPFVEKKKEYFK